MYQTDFFKAKNNSLTCKIQGVQIHSAYNPENEAERYVKSLSKPPFNPKYILLIEPALAYTLPFLEKNFPESKILSIRFSNDFREYDNKFFKTFYFSLNDSKTFENKLTSFFGEDGLLFTNFITWEPTQKVFSEESKILWDILKKEINLSQQILNTKAFFAKRWIKNSIIFIKNIKKIAKIQKGSSDVIICASGDSLRDSVEKLKIIRKKIFLIAVSSSLKLLLENNIEPDLVISTDGGFWAKMHLKKLLKYKDIPLALSTESNILRKTFENTAILPLHYSDGFGSNLLKKFSIPFIEAERNGTVSGTAEKLALSISSGNVYFIGLDLFPGKAKQHSDPNELEIFNSMSDIKIKSKENRVTGNRFNSKSLKIYENWFSQQDLNITNRVYRLSNNYKYENKLGNIKDINFEELKIQEKAVLPIIKREFFNSQVHISYEELLRDQNFLQECFPIEWLSYTREAQEEKKGIRYQDLLEKADDFINSLKRI